MHRSTRHRWLINQFGDELRMVVTPEISRENLQSALQASTGKPHALSAAEPNLEDVFIALTQDRKAAA